MNHSLVKPFSTQTVIQNLKIPYPIHVFSLQEFEIRPELFYQEHKAVFSQLQADQYDAKREQIEFLLTHNPKFTITEQVFDYYIGKAPSSILDPYYQALTLQ